MWQRLELVSQRSVLRGVEADVRGGAGRVVGIEQRLDRALADECRVIAGGDPVAGHVRQLLIHEQRRDRCRPCRRGSVVEPLLGDALELAEEVELAALRRDRAISCKAGAG